MAGSEVVRVASTKAAAALSYVCMRDRVFPGDRLCPKTDIWSRMAILLAHLTAPDLRLSFVYKDRFQAFGANDTGSVMGSVETNESQLTVPSAFLSLERLERVGEYLGPWHYGELALVYHRRLTAPSLNLALEDVYPPAICLLLGLVWGGMVGHRRLGRALGVRRRSLVVAGFGLLFVVLKHYLKAKMVRFYNRPVAVNHGIQGLAHLWQLCEARHFRLLYDSDAAFGKLNSSSPDTAAKLARFARGISQEKGIEELLNSTVHLNVLLTDNHNAMELTSSKLFLRATFLQGQSPFLLVSYTSLKVSPNGPLRPLSAEARQVMRTEYERRVSFSQRKSLWLNAERPAKAGPKPLSLGQMRIVVLTLWALVGLATAALVVEVGLVHCVVPAARLLRHSLRSPPPRAPAYSLDWILY